jgi:diguanylate cyclase (GGDEF)-like protein/PAS domain S-box-containing protein
MPDAAPVIEDQVTRLARRLERERAARREAETISERVTRELYERQAELELLETVAVASNQAATIEEAMQVAVDRVCAHTGWPVGHVYLLDRSSRRLMPTTIWHVDHAKRYVAFRQVTEATGFPSGVGLPGRVLASGQPAWITDVRDDANFPRASAARAVGVRAGFAFPVVSGTQVLAVLEFFSPNEAELDDGLLALMAHVGTQLGRVVERRCGEEERARLNRQTEVLLSSAGEGIYGLDANGLTTFVNPAAARMLRRRAEDLIGAPVHDVVHGNGHGGRGHTREQCPLATRASDGAASKSDEDVFWRGDGASFPVEFIRIPIRDNGAIGGAVVTFNDVTERKRFESQLRFLAEHDGLTGLFNRRRFEEELARQVAYARRYGGGAALVLDIDNFKYVNDTLGHQAGDELIRSVATLLRKRLRATDVLARLGGDEFAVLLPHTGSEQAEEVAHGLLKEIRAHTTAVADQPIRVTTSIGVTLLGQEELTAEEVLVEADIAMYEAKDAGRDCCVIYTRDSRQRARQASGMTWTKRIRRALEEDGFVLYCQPILDLRCDTVSQYELLLRMRGDQDGEVILPGAFLPPAERFGLIRDIDHWVVREAVQLLSRLEREGSGIDLLLEINLSGKSVGDPDLPGLIERALADTAVDPAKLIFEITETAAIANMEEASSFAHRLTKLGCRFALDDFGAGFGSFYYLKYLPLDYLKIDGDFIENLVRSPVDQRMVKAMVEVARALEMKTIAEYVSDEESVRLLRDFGVDYAQGFHLGKPAPVGAVGLKPHKPPTRPPPLWRARSADSRTSPASPLRCGVGPANRGLDAADALG